MQRENELYESILNKFKVKEEIKESKLEEKTQTIQAIEQPSEIQTQHIEHKTEHLRNKIHYRYPISAVVPNKAYEMLHPNKQVIVNEFVDRFLNNHDYSNDVRKKYSTIARESKWYNQKMDEYQVRDFFYNLTMQADKENFKNKNHKHKGN